jgi:glycosyltransferase involved in cell wall biosynthesis
MPSLPVMVQLTSSTHLVDAPTVSLVIPVWNEAESLLTLFDAVVRLEGEMERNGIRLHVVLTDNQSSDRSWDIIAAELSRLRWAEAHQFSRNFGFQESILFGLSCARGDCAVVLQSDLQDPPELIHTFIRLWREGAAVVAGQATTRAEGHLMNTLRRAFYGLLNRASEGPMAVGVQDFYLLDRRIIDDVVASKPPTQLLRTYVAEHFGFSALVPYERRARAAGEASLTLADYYQLAMDGLLLSGSRAIRFVTVASFMLAGLAVGAALGLLLAFVFGWRPVVSGWLSLSIGFALMLALVGAAAGITVEYLRRLAMLVTPGPRARVWRSLPVSSEVAMDDSPA